MSALPKISETEWEVMKIVWLRSPIPAGDIIAHLHSQDPDWHPKTVKTLLNRLVRKKALGFHKEGRAYLYRPLVSEKQCVRLASESFLDRVFGGAVKPMLAHLVEHNKLSRADIEELKQILEGRKK